MRNHFAQPAAVTVSPVLPDGWSVVPGDRSLQVDAGALAVAEFRLSPPTVRRSCCRDVIPIEVTVAGRRFGQAAEVLVSAA